MAHTRNSGICYRKHRKTHTIARSARRRLTCKRSQTGKEISTVTNPGDLLLVARHNPVRVTHTERLVLATVSVKSLKPKELSRSQKYGDSIIDHIDGDRSLHGCHVAGVQESCIKGNVTREQQHFVAYTSGANGKRTAWRRFLGTPICVDESKRQTGTLLSPFAGPQD